MGSLQNFFKFFHLEKKLRYNFLYIIIYECKNKRNVIFLSFLQIIVYSQVYIKYGFLREKKEFVRGKY